jgi:hypothetical protein
VIVDGLDAAGLYELSHAGRTVATFALSFVDSAESDLSTALPGKRDSEDANATVDSALSWFEYALLALALAALLFDWWFLQRGLRAASAGA